MSASASPFDLAPEAVAVPCSARAVAEVRVRVGRVGASTQVASLYETGGLRLRFPNAGASCEGVLINTGGGIAGGDRVGVSCDAEAGARICLTTQSAEKVYRAETNAAEVAVSLRLAPKANVAWIPQETILFDGARLKRTFEVSMAGGATLTVAESVVFGRIARAERLREGLFADRWRVLRDGRLVFAEDVRTGGNIATLLDRPACGNGARAVATVLHVAGRAEARLASLRRVLGKAQSVCGASAYDGMLVARFASADPAHVRADVARVAEFLMRAALPRVWAC